MFDLPSTGSGKPVTVTTVAGVEVKFSLQTADADLIRLRWSAANTQLEQQFQAVRSGPSPISQKNIVALSGEIYDLYVNKFEENPGTPDDWAAVKAFTRAALEGRLLSPPVLAAGAKDALADAYKAFGRDLTAGVNALPETDSREGLERRFGPLADWVLARHHLVIEDHSRALLLQRVGEALHEAAKDLKRNAGGDYSPSPARDRFPPLELHNAISLSDLFGKWAAETKPSASTLSSWRGHLRSLEAHLGEDAADVAKVEADRIVGWKDGLVQQGLAARTINEGYLGFANAVFNYAVRNKLLKANPANGVRVSASKKAGTKMLPYTDAEVARLLGLAANESSPPRRWLPLLAAATGARVGELAQLWGENVRELDGVQVLAISPAEDGGTLKTADS